LREQEPDLTQVETARRNPFHRFLGGIMAAAERIKLGNLTEKVTYAPPDTPPFEEPYQPQQQLQARQPMGGYRAGDPELKAAGRLYGHRRA
jgi:hypothetical protein